MKKLALAALAAFSPLVITPSAAIAQEAAPEAQVSAHAQLYDAMQAGVDQDAVLDNTLSQLAQQFVLGNPQLAELEQEQPGILNTLISNMRPVIRQYSQRVNAQYRPDMIAAIGSVMTQEESLALAGFYSSPLGRRTMQAATQNVSVGNSAQDAAAGREISAESVNDDLTRTGQQALATMSIEDRAELNRAALATPGFLKMPMLQQAIAPIRAEMENAPPTAEEMSGISDAVITTVESYQL